MLQNYLDQLEAADRLGFGVGWIAQAHLSTEVQKRNLKPVIPHWDGEVGLCTDFFQLAMLSMERTENIEVGSAVLSILANGGPIAVAERIGNYCALQAQRNDSRTLHLGFSAGRFEFMARPYGIIPRNAVEDAAWPALRGQIFWEACEIMLRLARGDTINSGNIRETVLSRENFRSDDDWERVQLAELELRGHPPTYRPELVCIDRRYVFEDIKSIPQEWDRSKVNFVIGSHEAALQEHVNTILPVQVFNLSITPPEVIEETHDRMLEAYHASGGPWQRKMMPRTVMIFLNAEDGLSPEEQSLAAREEAKNGLSSYWKALEGTLDPAKVDRAVNNALIGNVDEIISAIRDRFHPEDRLMCWFDFFRHDSERVIRDMEAFSEKIMRAV